VSVESTPFSSSSTSIWYQFLLLRAGMERRGRREDKGNVESGHEGNGHIGNGHVDLHIK